MTVYGKLWEPLSSNQGKSQSNMDPQEGNFQWENHPTAWPLGFRMSFQQLQDHLPKGPAATLVLCELSKLLQMKRFSVMCEWGHQ